MIVSFASGRLGNQLFEYSYILSKTKENEKIKLYFFDELFEIFDIKNKCKHTSSKNKFSTWFHHKLWRLYIKFREKNIVSWIKEDTDSWKITEEYNKSNITFIEGYFQNDDAITETLLSSLSFKKTISNIGNEIIKSFPNDKQLCFIHIRHGDYDKNMRLPDEYYSKAINNFNPESTFFYITGDDPKWSNDFFSFLPNKIISNNSMSTDLYIMSQCKCGIVSNSTFAYWGAILGKKDKKIFAPEYWIGFNEKKWNPSEKIRTKRFTYIQ